MFRADSEQSGFAMVLKPLNCTRCGAALRDEPDNGLMRCAHCGQNHAFVPPQPPHDPQLSPARSSASPARPTWLVPVALLGALALVGVAATALLSRGGAPGYGAAAGAEGPGDASGQYSAGEAVDVYWGTSWWPGTIKAALGGGRYRIGYDGWSSSWDEDVTPRRLRRRGTASAAPGAVVQDRAPDAAELGDATAVYALGDVVDIHWGQSWWPGRIVAVSARGYHVSYDGWSSSHDETVDATRLRRR